MRYSAVLFAVLAVAPLTRVTAQEPPPVKVGDRVRVTAPDINKYDGTLQAMRGDALTVDTLRIAVASVMRLDVYRGRKSNVGKGVLLGGIPSGILLGIYGGALCADETWCEVAAGFALGFGVGFAGGALIGGVIGAIIKSDRWEEVPLDQLRVSFAPQRDGRFSLGFNVAF